MFAKGSDAAVIVFDQTNLKTYEHVDDWYNYIRTYSGDKTIIYLAANKTDLPPAIPTETSLSWASEHNIKMMNTSATDGTNVKALFETISRHLVKPNETLINEETERKNKTDDQVIKIKMY